MALLTLLSQFLVRLSFGLAAGMAVVEPREVTSGYFRNHLYVTLGLSTLAALASKATCPAAVSWEIAAAALSYVGAVCWLYEQRRGGVAALFAVAATGLVAALVVASELHAAAPSRPPARPEFDALRVAHVLSSGLLLGTTMAAMLLGHWYLNAPGMKLRPLRTLLAAMAAAGVLHAVVCGWGLSLEASARALSTQEWIFLALRWIGLLGVGVLVWMAWQTLAVPNTQSATGILYVAVIATFMGETMSLLLSTETIYPV
jgi:hypothetical protein